MVDAESTAVLQVRAGNTLMVLLRSDWTARQMNRRFHHGWVRHFVEVNSAMLILDHQLNFTFLNAEQCNGEVSNHQTLAGTKID